jgi:glutamyl-tRNA synthetase
MAEVRTRFAPSPTGDLHVGGVRTALFSWLTAKHEGGKFFIRFEDTDQERYVVGSSRKILETFDWLGIKLDGGPDHASLQKMKSDEDYAGALVDCSFDGIPGPFVQSQRLDIYKQHAEQLIASGHAYRANETPEELEQMRKAAEARKENFRFKAHMRLRTDIQPDEPHVVRLMMPNDGQTRFDDLIKGEMVFENANLDDPVLLKTDGFATYHLAAMVDDYLMGVTHVIRADEWLASAPKHIQIYKAFGWPLPHFAHVPNVLGGDGKKLSKRHGATSVFELRDQGYIPEAVINFLAMLGWAPGQGDEQNIFSIDELFQKFSLGQVGSSPAVFEYAKLEWMNFEHLRRLPAQDLAQRLLPFLAKEGLPIDTEAKMQTLLRVLPLIQAERLKKLAGAAPLIDFFFQEIETPPMDMLIGPKMEQHFSVAALRLTREALASLTDFNDEPTMEKTLNDICDELKLKRGQLFTIVRNAVSGKSVTPPLFGTMIVLGREVTLARIDKAIARLQGG